MTSETALYFNWKKKYLQ